MKKVISTVTVHPHDSYQSQPNQAGSVVIYNNTVKKLTFTVLEHVDPKEVIRKLLDRVEAQVAPIAGDFCHRYSKEAGQYLALVGQCHEALKGLQENDQ